MITRVLSDAMQHPVMVAGISITLKATILLLIARITALLLRHRSATERHLLLVATFVGLLAVPLLHFTLPPITTPWLPSVSAPPAVTTVSRVDVANLATRSGHSVETTGARLESAANGSRRFPPVWLILVSIWIAGTLATLLPVFLSLAHRRALLGLSPRILSPDWKQLADNLCASLGIRSPVTLIRADDGVVPLTWGVRQPVVLLPLIAEEWNEECRRAVLHHELAHVRRADAPVLLGARTICAIYWFHPLVWRALRDLRIQQELAADELVLRSGSSRLDYAAGLVEVARQIGRRHRSLAFAAALSPASFFEHRLRAIVSGVTYTPFSRRTRSTLALTGVGVFMTLGAVQPAAQNAPPQTPQQPIQPVGTFSAADDGHFRINWPTPRGEGTITLIGSITFGPTLDDYRLSPGGSVIMEEREGDGIARRAELTSAPTGVVLRSWNGREMAVTRTLDDWANQMLRYLATSLALRERQKGLEKARGELEALGGLLPGKLNALERSRRLVDLDALARRRLALIERRQALEKSGQPRMDVLQIDLELLALNLEELRVAGYEPVPEKPPRR